MKKEISAENKAETGAKKTAGASASRAAGRKKKAKKIRKETRTEAREKVMQLIFQMEALDDFSKERAARFWQEAEGESGDGSQRNYREALTGAVCGNLGHIDHLIEASSENWKADRIARVDLAICRVAAAEILFLEDVPPSVAVNEAVNMAKKYSTEESGRFLNGILGTILRQYGPKEPEPGETAP